MKSKFKALPTRCPVCHDGYTGPVAIKVHNEIASATGCRSYEVKKS